MFHHTKRITLVILSIFMLMMAGLFRMVLGDPEPAPALLQQQPIQRIEHSVDRVQAELDTQKGPQTEGLQQNLFHPTKPGDVLVTEQFLFRGPPNPEVSGYIEQAKEFADPNNARHFYIQGLSHKMRGDYDAALAAHLKAVELLETDRHQLRDERSRGIFSEDTIHFYYAAILHLLDRHRFAEAFALLEQSRSRAMADMLASQTPELSMPEKRVRFAELQQSKAEIALGQQELFALRSQAAPAQQEIDDLEKGLQKREEAYQQFLSQIAKDAPRLLELGESKPVSLQVLQQSMQEERYEVLSYLALDAMTILWHISGDAIHVRNVFLPRSQLIDKVARLRKSILAKIINKEARFDEQTAQELFLFLIQPALQWITSNHLVILPHEALYGVPFQVFQDPSDHRYLGERFQLSYAPSATILLRLKQMDTLAGGRLLAIETTGLDEAKEELKAIASLYPNTHKVGNTKADLKAWAGDYDLLHLSAHGTFNPAAPLLSYLELSKGGQDDGRLTAAEMFGLPLTKTRLVVLSACEIGQVEATHANEILGMVRALIYAGANTLISSSWEVNAESTKLWMKTFYQEAQSKPVREAARLALVAVKNDPKYAHPFHWGPFVVIGK